MRNYKKILAAGLAVSMVMGSSVVAFAAEGSGSGWFVGCCREV